MRLTARYNLHDTINRRALLLALMAAAACQSGVDSVSTNPGDPLVVQPADVNILGTSESIALVRDLDVRPNGSVWVLNSVEPLFVGFAPDGSIIGEHGSLGGGPEEFPAPSAFLTGGFDGEAWVLDARRHALIKISDPDGEWAEVALPRDVVPPGSLAGGMSLLSGATRTDRIGREVILPRTTGSRQSGFLSYRMAMLTADLVALDLDTQSSRELLSLAQVLGDPTAGFELTDGGFPLWYRLWATCGEDEIRVLDRMGNVIRGFDRNGTELDSIPLPPVAVTAVTPRQFAIAVYGLRAAEVSGAVGQRLSAEDSLRLINESVERIQGTPAQLANYLPRYVDLRCTEGGVLWIQPIDVERGGLLGGPAWLRIEPDGTTREVHLPDGFDAFRFTSERIWGVQRDELDVASIAWVGVDGVF
ncbi:MAG: hypothetical protein ACR2QM_06685 [Longimicrobiales bacterium]